MASPLPTATDVAPPDYSGVASRWPDTDALMKDRSCRPLAPPTVTRRRVPLFVLAAVLRSRSPSSRLSSLGKRL